ncbi:Plasmodium exported protein, unknown function [Plasmodium vivax]|uniref:Uncharacterized protein n=1 Tax=Plasmodium vivax TaxID=5855 RepID=A0A1G4EDB1_PLAVI|nr:Plasmodium exported protein, unknown function [Plasmodium vivax]VUZ95044.1 Plasmodium exported protein, unknown function [Plasmodium vivax]
MNKLNLIFLFNIVSLIFSTWISQNSNDGIHNIYLNTKYNKGNTGNVRNNRLLTNDVPQSEIGQTDPSNNVSIPGEKNKLKDITDSSEIHEKLNKDISNSICAYIKKLEHGYTNKKGLKRLDCHYEKKLFNEMYKLDNIEGHMKSKNSYFKKVIWKRYGLRFFIFSLVILFGIATTIVSCITENDVKCIGSPSASTPGACKFCSGIGKFLYIPNSIIYIPLIIAFLYFIIYILSKVRKYKRLKEKYGK